MIQLRLGTPNERKNIIADETNTPMDVLEREDVILDGANISLNGIPLSYQDLGISFDDLGVEDSATLSVVVKTGNAH